MRPATVFVRSSETDAVFEIAAELAEGNDTLTILDPAEVQAEESEATYDEMVAKELSAEVSRRNEGRSDDDLINPTSGRKPDMIAALVADDTK